MMGKKSDEEEIRISREVADKLMDYEDMPFSRDDVKGVSVIVSGDSHLLAKSAAGPEKIRGGLMKVAEFMAEIYKSPKRAAKSIIKLYEKVEDEEEGD